MLQNIDPDDNFFNDVYSGLSQHKVSPYYNIEQFNRTFDNGTSTINIFSMNVRSFNRNGEMCTSLLGSLYCPPNIIVLSETWLEAGDQCTSDIEGYTAFHTIREQGRSGRVSVYIDETMSVRPIIEITLCNDCIETCVVEVSSSTETFVVLAVYRPHSGTVELLCQQLDEIIQSPQLNSKSIILLGDINADLLKQNDQNIVNFMTLMHSFNFLPLITKATRFPPPGADSSPSLLDHIWSNSFTQFSSGIITSDITDHCPTFLILPRIKNVNEKIKITFREHADYAIELFGRRVSEFMNNLDLEGNLSAVTELLITELDKLYRTCFPLKTKFVSHKRLSKPWLTSAIIKSIKTKAHYFKLSKLGIISNELNKAYRNKLNSVIRLAKRTYYRRLFSDYTNDIKRTWKAIRSLLTKKQSNRCIKSLIVNGNILTNSYDIADSFSSYFSNIGNSMNDIIPNDDTCPLSYVPHNMASLLFLNPVTRNEIIQVIYNLKSTSSDSNAVPVSLLKRVSGVLAETVAYLVNKSFRNGIFPECLKIAKVVPIYKSGDPQDLANYRPISILPVFSKIFERCMAVRLMNFLLRFNLISSNQFGFLRGKSAADAFTKLTEYIYSCLNKKEHCMGIFVDLKKAFDTVNHSILLRKLERYGVRGSCLTWFNSYLRDRKQFVSVAGQCSAAKTIEIGVPQGSIIGPILFLIYINDLPFISDLFSPILYADDTTLLAKNIDYTNLMHEINSELPKLYQWLNVNRLSLNLRKTFSLLFSNRRDTIEQLQDMRFEFSIIELETTVEYLGLIIDNNLKFTYHIQTITKKVSRNVGIFYRLKNYVPARVLLNLYYSLVYPYLLYGNVAWGGTNIQHLTPLLVLQKKIVRIITGSEFLAHSGPLFKQTGILKITDLHKYLLCLHMYKLRHSNNRNIFENIHNYETRQQGDAHVVFQRLAQTQRSLSYAAPLEWNALPHEIRGCETYSIFKKRLKAYIIDAYM